MNIKNDGDDVVATYAFQWRGLDESIIGDEQRTKQVAELAQLTLGEMPWDDPPSIDVSPNLNSDGTEFLVTLAW